MGDHPSQADWESRGTTENTSSAPSSLGGGKLRNGDRRATQNQESSPECWALSQSGVRRKGDPLPGSGSTREEQPRGGRTYSFTRVLLTQQAADPKRVWNKSVPGLNPRLGPLCSLGLALARSVSPALGSSCSKEPPRMQPFGSAHEFGGSGIPKGAVGTTLLCSVMSGAFPGTRDHSDDRPAGPAPSEVASPLTCLEPGLGRPEGSNCRPAGLHMASPRGLGFRMALELPSGQVAQGSREEAAWSSPTQLGRYLAAPLSQAATSLPRFKGRGHGPHLLTGGGQGTCSHTGNHHTPAHS